MQISNIYIYPIKSLAGISLSSCEVSDRGLLHDRRWMLVRPDGEFLTQRSVPIMAQLHVALLPEGLAVWHLHDPEQPFIIPYAPQTTEYISTSVWGNPCEGQIVSTAADTWFSAQLQTPCRLIYMTAAIHRHVSEKRALNAEIVSYADGYPHLIIGQASLDLLNSKLEASLPMNRFRPNFVFTGGAAHDEDTWASFRIGKMIFHGVKDCVRCEMTTLNQETLERGKEPLRTLASYRRSGKGVIFGQNLLHEGSGTITVGDPIEVLRMK